MRENQTQRPRSIALTTAVLFFILAFIGGLLLGSTLTKRTLLSPTTPQPNTPVAHDTSGHPENFDQNLAAIQQEIARNPNEPINWIVLGNLHYDAHHPDEAIKAYERALSLQPGNSDVMTDMGTMYRIKGEPEKAVALYTEVITNDPLHQNAYFNKGVTLMIDLADPDGAVEAWRALLAANPNAQHSNGSPIAQVLPWIIVDGGSQLEKRGNSGAALRAYDLALEVQAGFEPALSHKTVLLQRMGRQAEAQETGQEALRLNPGAVAPDGTPLQRLLMP